MLQEDHVRVERLLDGLGCAYTVTCHQPVYTMRDVEALGDGLPVCRNLYLFNKDGLRFLMITNNPDRVDLRRVADALHVRKLLFAPEEMLFEDLALTPGSVSPFGLINDKNRRVRVLLDKSVKGRLAFHPNRNDRTVVLSLEDLMKFFAHVGAEVTRVRAHGGG